MLVFLTSCCFIGGNFLREIFINVLILKEPIQSTFAFIVQFIDGTGCSCGCSGDRLCVRGFLFDDPAVIDCLKTLEKVRLLRQCNTLLS